MQPHHVEAFEPVIARSNVLMAQLEVPLETVALAMELGRKHQVTTILNPAPGQRLELDMITNVDVMTPNESETRILLGLPPDDPTPTLDLARQLLDLGVENIIVTRGERGALIVTAQGTEAVPTTPVQALDVTGAGDSFNAALAVGIGEGMDLRTAVEQATRAGAYTTTHLGVIDGLPTRTELEAFPS